jgi:serine/threonine protein kinase
MTSTEKKKAISKEIEILKNISHPNIIKIIDSYQTPETVNIVMESVCRLPYLDNRKLTKTYSFQSEQD